jgi:hypothetical protein
MCGYLCDILQTSAHLLPHGKWDVYVEKRFFQTRLWRQRYGIVKNRTWFKEEINTVKLKEVKLILNVT